MKNILEKMIYAAASRAMVVAVVFTFSSSGVAQNHNPEFSVSNLHFDGSNYIFIGEDDGQAYDPRTKLVLNYREDIVPEKGTVTLQWVADPDQDIKDGSSRVLAYGTESGTTGFTDGNGKTSTSGPWKWNEYKLDDYKGREMFLQGVADDSFAGDVVKLQASHTETVDDYAKEFMLLKVELEPITDLKADDIDPNGALNQIRNPAGIVIESAPNDSNVAIFEITTSLDDDEANEIIHWEIEPDGGNASFYPANDNDNNKGKVVKVNGSSAGRVKINVYVGEPDEDSEPVVFTEALVVEPKSVPYRANIIKHADNPELFLPHANNDLPDAFKVANIILRQAGFELIPSTDTSTGNIDKVENGIVFQNQVPGLLVFTAFAELIGYTENVAVDAFALSINHKEAFQITFVNSLDDGESGRSTYRKPSGLEDESDQGDVYAEAAYKTSLNDTFDEDLLHRLNVDLGSTLPQTYPNLHGVLIGWSSVGNINGAGQTIAHELAHGMNVLHRAGNTNDHFDGLETQQNGKLLGDSGTNVMDYPAEPLTANHSGLDIDYLQVFILRHSPILE